MQSQSELCQTFSKFRQIRPRCPLLLEAHHTVVCVSQHDDLPSPWLFPPVLNPQIEGVVQVDVCKQRADHAIDAKGNFEFERRVALCRVLSVLDLRRKR